jgi:hypothetical protein
MSAETRKPTDQTVKMHLVLITAALSLVGFVLEIGPVAGIFPVMVGLSLELPTLGFLPYLALAASAAVGLHISEEEPTPKEKKPETPDVQPTPEGEMVGQRVRPELAQMRMAFTALGGYALLKGINLALMWPLAAQYGVAQEQLISAFQFGFVYTALGWFVLWQFLRWYAQRRKWVRLLEELVGGNATRIVAFVILIKPLINILNLIREGYTLNPLIITEVLLNLAVVAAAALLWSARPVTMRRTVMGLLTTGGVIVLFTVLRAFIQR